MSGGVPINQLSLFQFFSPLNPPKGDFRPRLDRRSSISWKLAARDWLLLMG